MKIGALTAASAPACRKPWRWALPPKAPAKARGWPSRQVKKIPWPFMRVNIFRPGLADPMEELSRSGRVDRALS